MKISIAAFLFALISLTSGWCDTPVSGDVSGVWTKANSPYIVTGDVKIADDAVLDINEGVVVKFDGTFEFAVEGVLTATGTESDSIIFTHNHPDSSWKGIRIDNADSQCRFEYCAFRYSENSYGGGLYVNNSNIAINRCRLTKTKATSNGGAIYLYQSNLTVGNTEFKNCQADGSGGAIYCAYANPGDRLVVRECSITECRGYSGGGVYCENSNLLLNVVGSTFIKNNAFGNVGGAIVCNNFYVGHSTFIDNYGSGGSTLWIQGKGQIINCIIFDTYKQRKTVGLWFDEYVDIINCIFRNVTLYTQYGEFQNLKINYSNISGGWPGVMNIDTAPLFADPAAYDFHLTASSPCINTGAPSAFYNDVDGTRNDMGIYGGSGLFVSADTLYFRPAGRGQTKEAELYIGNFRDKPFVLQSARIEDTKNFTLSSDFPVTIPSYGLDTVHVQFHPAVEGLLTSSLTFSSQDFYGLSKDADVILKGIGGLWEGEIAGTWTKSNSPYIVGGDVLVPEGEMLIIEPGVTVRIDTSYSGGPVEFLIEGSLDAAGGESDSITFTMVPGQENPGSWSGLLFDPPYPTAYLSILEETNDKPASTETEALDGQADDSLQFKISQSNALSTIDLQYCTIQFAKTGVRLETSEASVSNCRIQHNSEYGVWWYGSDRDASGILTNSVISHNGRFGIYCQSQCYRSYTYVRPIVSGNSVSHNQEGGIYVNAWGGSPSSWTWPGGTWDECYASPVIENNIIFENTGPAIKCFARASLTTGMFSTHKSVAFVQPKIAGNILLGNAEGLTAASYYWYNWPVYYSFSNIETDHNTFYGNEGTQIAASDSTTEIVVTNSIFWNYTGQNIAVQDEARVTATYCDFQSEQAGDSNISLDPNFINPAQNDLRLNFTSSCIDAGDPNAAKDPDSTRADMGALYYHQSISDFNLRSPSDGSLSTDLMPVLSWEVPTTTGGENIKYDLAISTTDFFEEARTQVITDIEKNEWQPPKLLDDNTTYYWKVLAKNPWSLRKWSDEVWSFTAKTDTTPPYFSEWILQPANLTEDTDSDCRISVVIHDDGVGLGGTIPQCAYTINSQQYSEWKNMEKVNGMSTGSAKQSGKAKIEHIAQSTAAQVLQQDMWGFSIFPPAGSWEEHSGDTLCYRVRCSDAYQNVVYSPVQKEWIDAINDPPVLASLPDLSFPEDTFAMFDLDEFASDIDNAWDELSFSAEIVGFSTDTLLTASSAMGINDLSIEIDPENHVVTFRSTADSSGRYDVSFTVMDPAGLSDADTMTVIVASVNDAPSIADLPRIVFDEDDSVSVGRKFWYDYVDDKETADDDLMFEVNDGRFVEITHRDSSFVFKSPHNWFGVDTLWLSVQDTEGMNRAKQFQVQVNSVNDPPYFVGLVDSLVFASDSSAVLYLWDYVEDVETQAIQLKFDFSADNDALSWIFNSNTGNVIIMANNFAGLATFYIDVIDDEKATARDSVKIRVTSPTGIEMFADGSPRQFRLCPNFPNPFNPSTRIPFSVPRSAYVEIAIYDVKGCRVEDLVHRNYSAGNYIIEWQAAQNPSGTYFIEMRTETWSDVKKCVLVK